MADVEPQGCKANQVDGQYPPLAEGSLQVERTVLYMFTLEFGQLHLGPELHEVKNHEAAHDDTQNEHVLRCPFYVLGTGIHSIAVVAACLAVLPSEPERKDDVNRKTGGQYQRSGHGIPIGTEEFADFVIGLKRDEGHCIHQRMECDEQDKEEAGYRHHHLASDR